MEGLATYTAATEKVEEEVVMTRKNHSCTG